MGKNLTLSTLCLASALSLPSLSHANEQQGDAFNLLLGAGITFGGDDLVEVYYDNDESEDIEAGGFVDLKGGFSYQEPGSSVRIQATIGYMFDNINAENFDASFTRFPAELLIFHNTDNHHIGFGGTYHMATNLEVDGLGLDTDLDFDDSLGLVVEYAYDFENNFHGAIRAVSIDYTAEGASEDVDGNHIGIYGYFVF